MTSNTPEKAREYYLNYKQTLNERNKNKKYCSCCNTLITPWNWSKHTKTHKHIRNEQTVKDNTEDDSDKCKDYEKYVMNQYDNSE